MVALLDGMGRPLEGMLRRLAVCELNEEGEVVNAKTFFLQQATIGVQEPAIRCVLQFVNETEGHQRYRLAAEVDKLYTREQAIAVMQQEAIEKKAAEEPGAGA